MTTAKDLAVKIAAEELIALGYRRTSNKHKMISRIDRPDWLIVLAKNLRRSPAEFYVPGEREPAATWCDHYRRVHSKDTLEVEEAVFRAIPGSGYDNCGYVDPEKL